MFIFTVDTCFLHIFYIYHMYYFVQYIFVSNKGRLAILHANDREISIHIDVNIGIFFLSFHIICIVKYTIRICIAYDVM